MSQEEADPFEIHSQFLSMLKKPLSASQIHRICAYTYEEEAHADYLFQGLLDYMRQVTLLSNTKQFIDKSTPSTKYILHCRCNSKISPKISI